jgi:hypothetical protein
MCNLNKLNEIAQIDVYEAIAMEKTGLAILTVMEKLGIINLMFNSSKKSILCLNFLSDEPIKDSLSLDVYGETT